MRQRETNSYRDHVQAVDDSGHEGERERTPGFFGIGDGRDVPGADHEGPQPRLTGPEWPGGPLRDLAGVGDHDDDRRGVGAVVLAGLVDEPRGGIDVALAELPNRAFDVDRDL